jgi:hypothetical protein
MPYGRLATVLTLASLVLSIAGFVYALVSWLRVPTAASSEPASEERKKGLDLRIELSSKLFDLGLLMLGVLWGFVLVDKDKMIQFSHWQNVILFASSNLLLLISLFSHLVYRIRLANLLWVLGKAAPPPAPAVSWLPNIIDELVEAPFRIQWMLFYASLVSVLLTIVIVKILGE